MKLLIVDDEYHVIKTVKYLINLSSLEISEILEAGSAKDAITIIEQVQPEILITDVMMNDVTGLELMNYLNHTNIFIKIIVISGYNNFEYIRAALRGGGVDYLLKPIDADQLIAAIQKAINAWRQEDEQRTQTQKHLDMISSMSTICKETLLYRMMTQSSPEKFYQELLPIMPKLNQCRTCIVSYHNCHPFLLEQSSVAYHHLTSACMALNQALEEQNIGLCFFNSDDGWELVLFLYHHTSESLRFLEEQLILIQQKFGISLIWGQSKPMAFPASLGTAFLQAKTAFYEQDVFSIPPSVLSYSQLKADTLNAEQPELEALLYSALITGNETLINSSVEQWCLSVFPNHYAPLHHALAVISRYRTLMEQWKEELTVQYSGLNIQVSPVLSYSQLLDKNSLFSTTALIQNVKFEMLQLFGELTSPTSHPQNDIIYQIAYYIRLNYDKPFSQFACAQLFYINKNYMCRKFKNTFHVSMISYLNQIRIDHAKKLLQNSSNKIKDIANLVGFEDEKYFSRQFHKHTGLSPNEYRLALTEPLEKNILNERL